MDPFQIGKQNQDNDIYIDMIRNNYFKFELKIQLILYVYLVMDNNNLNIKHLRFYQRYLCMDGLYPLETVFTLDDLNMYFLRTYINRYMVGIKNLVKYAYKDSQNHTNNKSLKKIKFLSNEKYGCYDASFGLLKNVLCTLRRKVWQVILYKKCTLQTQHYFDDMYEWNWIKVEKLLKY
eukprot:486762_1